MILKLEEVKDNDFLEKNNGVYKFFVNEELLIKFKNVLEFDNSINEYIEATIYKDTFYYCVYVGKCNREKGFLGRVAGDHMEGPAKYSTLRRTLIALLECSDDEITNFISDDTQCFFEILPVSNLNLILDFEKKMINASFRILNLDENDFYKKEEYKKNKNKFSKLRNKQKSKNESDDSDDFYIESDLTEALDNSLKNKEYLEVNGPTGTGKTAIVNSWLRHNKDKINSFYLDGAILKDVEGELFFSGSLILSGQLFSSDEIDRLASLPNLVVVVDNHHLASSNVRQHIKLLRSGYVIDQRNKEKPFKKLDNLEFVCVINTTKY